MPWWLLLALSAVIGWVCFNLYLHFHYKELDELLAAAGGVERAPPDLVDAWQDDGGPRSFTFLFGWAYGLLYLGAWSAVYAIAVQLRRLRSRTRSAAV
jgi:hypothetical protein